MAIRFSNVQKKNVCLHVLVVLVASETYVLLKNSTLLLKNTLKHTNGKALP